MTGPAVIFFCDGRPSFAAEVAELRHGVLTATGRFERRHERVTRSWRMVDVSTVRWQTDVLASRPGAAT